MKQQTESYLFVTLRRLPVPVLELSSDGLIAAANPVFEKIVGEPPLLRPIADFLTPGSVNSLRRGMSALAGVEGEDKGHTLRLRTASGTESHVFHLLSDEETSRVVLLGVAAAGPVAEVRKQLEKTSARLSRALDEIEQKLTENEDLSRQVQERNREVEAQSEDLFAMTRELHVHQEEVLRLNQQLERSARELKVASSGRHRFYGSMSHELRTPVNAVMGYNDLLLAGVYGNLNEQQELAVERSQRAVRHLRELINDILDIARIETGRLSVEIQEVDLPELLADVMATLQPITAAQGVEVQISIADDLGRIRTDPRRLRQALMNLVSYTIRNSRGRPVWIRCERCSSGRIAVEVVDNGVGMDEAGIDGVFDEFPAVPGDVATGTGLGLSIAKRLARLLGGDLKVSSTQGVGTTFHLLLPRVARDTGGGDDPTKTSG